MLADSVSDEGLLREGAFVVCPHAVKGGKPLSGPF